MCVSQRISLEKQFFQSHVKNVTVVVLAKYSAVVDVMSGFETPLVRGLISSLTVNEPRVNFKWGNRIAGFDRSSAAKISLNR